METKTKRESNSATIINRVRDQRDQIQHSEDPNSDLASNSDSDSDADSDSNFPSLTQQACGLQASEEVKTESPDSEDQDASSGDASEVQEEAPSQIEDVNPEGSTESK